MILRAVKFQVSQVGFCGCGNLIRRNGARSRESCELIVRVLLAAVVKVTYGARCDLRPNTTIDRCFTSDTLRGAAPTSV